MSEGDNESLFDKRTDAPAASSCFNEKLTRTESETEKCISNMVSCGNGPLLGSEELETYLPGRKAIVQVTTWNMGSLPLPKEHHLRKLFDHEEDEALKRIDIHVIAIQECWPDADAWELELQVCLGPGYAIFQSLSFGTLHISVIMRRDLLWFTTEPSDTSQSVRSGRLFKTKGSAGIGFGFFGSKFLFIDAHLTAGNESDRGQQRVEELKKILTANLKIHHSCDAVFICGDLNFRIALHSRDTILEALKNNNLALLLEKDELNTLFKRKASLPKYLESFSEAAAITFRPTYKYDLGTDNFDSSTKKRAPAYTDRIMYKGKSMAYDSPNVLCLAYESVSDMRVSDHRPVFAVFAVDIKPGFDTLPLTGARYKREVYVKALQKRARFLLERRKKLASTVCCLT